MTNPIRSGLGRRITRNVVALALVSLLTDISSAYLQANSHLPGPRSHLELLAALKKNV